MNGWVDFDAVKQAVNLEAVLRHYQVRGLHRRRGVIEGCCPIHRGARQDAFRADLNKNVFHCFACQVGGNVLDFVAAMERCSIRQAALLLQAWFGTQPPGSPPGSRQQEELVREKSGENSPLRFALSGIDSTHPYLSQRGIDACTAVRFGVGFYAGDGLLKGRIVIPIRNERGQVVAYAGRALDDRPPKYKLPAGFRKSLELFNLHGAAASGSQTVTVVEGYFDCLRVHQAGFPCVVALMGCSLSAQQESKLLSRFRRVVLLLDGDRAGREGSRAISTRLSRKCSVLAVALPDGVQPDQLPLEAIRRLLAPAFMLAGMPAAW